MRRGRWAGIAAVFAVTGVVAVSAGCGGGSSALTLDPVAAAATKTQQAGSARIRLGIAFRGPLGRNVRLRGTGAVDGTSGELAIGVDSLLQHTTLREIFLQQHGDQVVFVRLGLLASRLPGGKHWLELDLSKLGRGAGLDLGSLMSGSRLSPADLLTMLKAEGSKVQDLGAASIDGVATTHYRITIDLAKALQATGSTSPLLTRVAGKLQTVPVDVWIGKDGLLHRVGVSLDSSRRPFRLGLTMDIYDYGAQVTIAAPPSSDVFDVTQLAQRRVGRLFH